MRQAGTRECWRCRADVGSALACPQCEAVQPLRSGIDLFAVLGLPRSLALDAASLEERFHAASRAVHPDRHQTADERARVLSLAASAAVNRAYRTLREPVARGRYWLELHGAAGGEERRAVPPALATEVFATQEKLEELRTGRSEALRREVVGLREGLAARLRALGEELEGAYDRWRDDGTTVLDELRRLLSEIAYLRTLLGDVEDAIGEGLRDTDHRH
jgi:molecular chaperone HscB